MIAQTGALTNQFGDARQSPHCGNIAMGHGPFDQGGSQLLSLGLAELVLGTSRPGAT